MASKRTANTRTRARQVAQAHATPPSPRPRPASATHAATTPKRSSHASASTSASAPVKRPANVSRYTEAYEWEDDPSEGEAYDAETDPYETGAAADNLDADTTDQYDDEGEDGEEAEADDLDADDPDDDLADEPEDFGDDSDLDAEWDSDDPDADEEADEDAEEWADRWDSARHPARHPARRPVRRPARRPAATRAADQQPTSAAAYKRGKLIPLPSGARFLVRPMSFTSMVEAAENGDTINGIPNSLLPAARRLLSGRSGASSQQPRNRFERRATPTRGGNTAEDVRDYMRLSNFLVSRLVVSPRIVNKPPDKCGPDQVSVFAVHEADKTAIVQYSLRGQAALRRFRSE